MHHAYMASHELNVPDAPSCCAKVTALQYKRLYDYMKLRSLRKCLHS